MDSWVIDNMIESLVSGALGIKDFMRALQDGIEACEASAREERRITANGPVI